MLTHLLVKRLETTVTSCHLPSAGHISKKLAEPGPWQLGAFKRGSVVSQNLIIHMLIQVADGCRGV